MSFAAIPIREDQTQTMQRILDRLVAEGAAHAALIVTYPDGGQVVMRSSVQADEAAFLPLAAGYS